MMNIENPLDTHVILETLTDIASKFKPGAGEDALYEILSTIGLAVKADRTYLFDFQCLEDGNLIAGQRAEWVEVGQSRQIANPTLQNIDMADVGFSDWNEKMHQGESIIGLVKNLPEEQIYLLEKMQGIVSIIFMPVFKSGELVGALGCDDCKNERVWTAEEQKLFQVASDMIGTLCFSG